MNSFNPELQFKDTESSESTKSRISKLIELLTQIRGFKFMTTLVLVFKKIESKDKTKYNNFHLSSKAKAIINESNIENMFNYKIIAIIANIRKSLGKRSG